MGITLQSSAVAVGADAQPITGPNQLRTFAGIKIEDYLFHLWPLCHPRLLPAHNVWLTTDGTDEIAYN